MDRPDRIDGPGSPAVTAAFQSKALYYKLRMVYDPEKEQVCLGACARYGFRISMNST